MVLLILLGYMLGNTAQLIANYPDLTRLEVAAHHGAQKIATGGDAASVMATVATQLPPGDYQIDIRCTTSEIACVKVMVVWESIVPMARMLRAVGLIRTDISSEARMPRAPQSLEI